MVSTDFFRFYPISWWVQPRSRSSVQLTIAIRLSCGETFADSSTYEVTRISTRTSQPAGAEINTNLKYAVGIFG